MYWVVALQCDTLVYIFGYKMHIAQSVEAQETSAPLISQLLALIKCTNSRVKISHCLFVLLVVACLRFEVKILFFHPSKSMAYLTHIRLYGFIL